jgi:hypothetical protein
MGFLIDAVAHRAKPWPVMAAGVHRCVTTDANLAEIYRPRLEQRSLYAGLSLMVWILKREVRAFGGCLGMYRR